MHPLQEPMNHGRAIFLRRDCSYYATMTLTVDSTIHQILREKPEAADILFRFGMGCLGCALARGETLREAAQAHGIPLDELVDALGIEK
jgi:hybrid cluster-associated redox disulfide protein